MFAQTVTMRRPSFSAVKSRRIESIVDLLALTEATTPRLLDALEGQIARYMLISSGNVYRNYGGLHRKEAVQPIPTAMDEEARCSAPAAIRIGKPSPAPTAIPTGGLG
jgi:hypothetical protein